MPLRVAIAGNQSAIVGTLGNAVILDRYGCVMLSYDAYSTSIQNARIWPWYAWECSYSKRQHPFHVGIRFPDMNIQAGSVAKLRRNSRPCDRYSRRSLSWQKGFAADNPFRQCGEIRFLINAWGAGNAKEPPEPLWGMSPTYPKIFRQQAVSRLQYNPVRPLPYLFGNNHWIRVSLWRKEPRR